MILKFQISNIDYFFFDLFKDQNTNDHVTIDKKIYYRDVYLFVMSIKRMTVKKFVLKHLHLCFRNIAQT